MAVARQTRTRSGSDELEGIRKEIYLHWKFGGNKQAMAEAKAAGAFWEKTVPGVGVYVIERTFKATDTTSFTQMETFAGHGLISYVCELAKFGRILRS